MNQNFVCPNCNGYLNVDESIILSTETNTGAKGLIYFNPEIGNQKSSYIEFINLSLSK